MGIINSKNKKIVKYIYAVATLSGTIIGVGLFSLPYIATRVGLGIMLIYFLFLGSIVILIHLLLGELALKTKDFIRLPGFAQIYLGKWAKAVAIISNILGLFGALLAYLIVGGEFLNSLLSPLLFGNSIFYTFLYCFFGAVLLFIGTKAIARIEFWGLVLFLLALVFIFLKGLPFFNVENIIMKNGGFRDYFLPYGPLLFSLWGASLIPELEEMLGQDKKRLKKIILVGVLIPIFVYLFFILVVMGISGYHTSQEAVSGLKDILGNNFIGLVFLFGVLTTFTSFIALGLVLKKIFCYDLKFSKNLAWAVTSFIPLILFLVGLKNFIKVIGLVGAVMLAVDGILILLMYQKIKSKRIKLLTYPLILIFIIGIIYEVIYFWK